MPNGFFDSSICFEVFCHCCLAVRVIKHENGIIEMDRDKKLRGSVLERFFFLKLKNVCAILELKIFPKILHHAYCASKCLT
jgi:hypothetical protein